jgi:hypothetical protein
MWMYDDEINYDDDDDDDDDDDNDENDDGDDRYLYHLCYCCNNKVNCYIKKKINLNTECSRR